MTRFNKLFYIFHVFECVDHWWFDGPLSLSLSLFFCDSSVCHTRAFFYFFFFFWGYKESLVIKRVLHFKKISKYFIAKMMLGSYFLFKMVCEKTWYSICTPTRVHRDTSNFISFAETSWYLILILSYFLKTNSAFNDFVFRNRIVRFLMASIWGWRGGCF